MINKHSFSAYKFTSMSNLGFSAKDYSKLKYGSKAVARKFGVDLAIKFMCSTEYLNVIPELLGQKIVIASAPWKNISVASTALKDYFKSKFNPVWSESNPSLLDLKIHRAHSYNEDYGAMSTKDREKAITSDAFHIDAELIKEKILFLIDDVKITGAHERRLESLLNNVGYEGTVVFIYFAEYLGSENPDIENDLNYAFVKNLLDIDYIIKNDEFIFNTRTVKYILNSPREEFRNFIDYQSNQFCHSLVTELTGNEYHKLPEFRENYLYLKTKLN